MGKLQILDQCGLAVSVAPQQDQRNLVLSIDLEQTIVYEDPTDESLEGLNRLVLPMTFETWEAIKKQADQSIAALKEQINAEGQQAVRQPENTETDSDGGSELES